MDDILYNMHQLGETLSRPHHSVLSEETRIKVRFLNSFLLFLIVITFTRFVINVFLSLTEDIQILNFVIPLATSIIASFVYLGGRSKYYRFAFVVPTLYPIIYPWFNISVYWNNDILVADQLLLNTTLVLALGIVLCGLLYSDLGVLLYTLLSGIDLYIFYGIALDFPESWLIPKFSFLATLAFITVVSLRFRVLTYSKLMKQTEKYQRIYDSIRVGLVTIDRDGIIRSTNPTTLKILGYESNSLVGNNISLIGIDRNKQEFWRKQLVEKGYFDDVEVTLTKRDGTLIYVLTSASLIRDEHGRTQQIETVFKDMTEQKKTESIRKDLEKKRDDFITMTNHQIRTPLHISKGFSELLINKIDVLTPEEISKHLYSLQNNLNRLEKLITDVRTVQILEKDELSYLLELADLEDVMRKIVQPYLDLYQDNFSYTNLVINSSITVKIDFDSFQQAIDNIIENAIKQTDKDSRRVEIIIEKEENKGIITIRDNGVGIDGSQINQIFDKFISFQTDKSAIGTGIGLYIAQEIIKAHNGNITAECQGKGQGATFTITIPTYNRFSSA